MSTKESKALITGGTGYLCSHLINHIEFRSLFSELTSLGKSPKEERIKDKTNVRFQKVNLQEKLPEFKTIKDTDVFIHSAYLNNISADKKLLNEFKEKRIIFFSSAAVYGDSPEGKILEPNDHCDPISDYGLYKLELENFIKEKFKDYLILRISNPYAGENSSRNIYEIFKSNIEKNLPLNINSEAPEQIIRDFIGIEDFVKQVTQLIKEEAQGVFNISSGVGRSLESLLKELVKEDFKELEINYTGFKDDDIRRSVLKPY